MTLVPLVRRLDGVACRIPLGCPTCVGWSPVCYAEADGPDGEPRPERPETCPSCGRTVAIRLLRTVVGVGLGAI